MSLFDYTESEDSLFFRIKAEVLEGNIHSFLEEQFSLLGTIDNKRESKLLEAIATMTADEIFDCADNQTFPPAYEFVTYPELAMGNYLFPERSTRPMFQLKCFNYYRVQDVWMEGYNDFFCYMRKMVMQNSGNVLAKLFYIDIGSS